MLEALKQVKPIAGPRLAVEVKEKDDEQTATLILQKVAKVKGRYAQELAELLANPETPLKVPNYLKEAIEWVADEVTEAVSATGAAAKGS